ncbi:hypothetical protein BFC18_03225 [Alteromonas confluentis]|uniref:Serine aminopeptidase S33 domain-containing protein n=2 Tax=Alteromonas confluentis TaxID=1656094 RepID=A0A1E7ZFL6_9ALTE|nr:hypothetical protein BFC18_03225 [Alteromonas confluentis]
MVAERIESPTQIIHYEQATLDAEYARWGVIEKRWCSEVSNYCIPYRDGAAAIQHPPSLSFSVSRDFGNQFSFLKEVTLSPEDVGEFSGTVVLIHGYGAKKESWMNTGFYFQALGFRVIEPDLMGQGESQAPLGFGVRDGDLLAEFIEQIIPVADEPVYLVGHSMGALAAVKTARQMDAISGLILLAPMDRFDRATIGVAHMFKPRLSKLVPDSSIKAGAELALSRAGITLEQTDMFADLPALSVPILTYGSGMDLASNIRRTERWQGLNNVTRVINNNETHMSVIGISDTEHAVLKDWLSQTSLFTKNHLSAGR